MTAPLRFAGSESQIVRLRKVVFAVVFRVARRGRKDERRRRGESAGAWRLADDKPGNRKSFHVYSERQAPVSRRRSGRPYSGTNG